MDFYELKCKNTKNGLNVYPDFQVGKSKDLMVRGGDFYAIWDEETKIWTTDEFKVIDVVDNDLNDYINKSNSDKITASYMKDMHSGSWNMYKKYLKLCPDNNHQLDTKVLFANSNVKKSDYASRKLPYNLEKGPIDAYETLMNTLYSPEEREKIEWAIGAIISGDSKKIQKFLVFYGPAGTGKSTVLNIIQMMFDGYCVSFKSNDLVNGMNTFATDAFASNPLIAIEHDGDLSNIKDNSVLNTLVSHETIIINQKFKSKYEIKPITFLLMGSNKPVKITDAKSGLIRRIIDVHPTGNKIPKREYDKLMEQVTEEFGAIAYHCLNKYEELGFSYYQNYRPLEMMFETDQFFNFVEDNFDILSDPEGISLKHAYDIYKNYCEETGASYKLQMYKFKAELKNYFNVTKERYTDSDGRRLGYYFMDFDFKKFEKNKKPVKVPNNRYSWLDLKEQESNFDILCKDCIAQYANREEKPKKKWIEVNTTLNDISTNRLHYVKPPENHIVIDFDLKDGVGNKSLALNLEAAKKFPKTYAEVSKGGNGLHLHYLYTGDVNELSRLYDNDIEVKVFIGNSSLRRKLSVCNDIPVNRLEPGLLPLRERKKMVDLNLVKDEQHLRNLIKKNLNKEIHGATKPSIDFIYKLLEDAYYSGMQYDVSDMFDSVLNFAMESTHQADHCVKLVSEMKFESDEVEQVNPVVDTKKEEEKPIVFYDVEVFSNLFICCWKLRGKEKPVVRMINPRPQDIADIIQNFRLVGFNNRRYDNHIIYGRMIGETNAELYQRSQDIINGLKSGFAGQAWNLSYTDIYDYLSADNKMSLKKWEIKLGIKHHELGLPWNKPVPKHLWDTVADYCCDDVLATEAVFDATQGDFEARLILAELTGMTANDTTNQLSTKFIFGDNKKPQDEFNYRFMGEPEPGHTYKVEDDGITCWQDDGKPIFLGYKFENGKSSYLDVDDVGEGGYVFSLPGMYDNVWTFDIAGQHPASAIAEELFGPRYTKRFKDIVQLRLHIKHKEFDKAREMFDGKLRPYLEDESKAKALAKALKTVVNSVYGMTFSKFDFAFRDPRNKDNIVAKRGSLFMINLRNLVQRMGYTVIHCKTDSIKVVDPDEKIFNFIMEYGKAYGYSFEIEHKFEKICLVNKSTYIAKMSKDDDEWIDACKKAKKDGKPEPTRWTATGAQFAVPYVFKTLFTHEKIGFEDLCETKSVKSEMYIDIPIENKKYTEKDAAEFLILSKAWNSKAPTALERCAKKLGYSLEEMGQRYAELQKQEAKTHRYQYIGKVGQFTPVIGHGGTLVTCSNFNDEENRKFSSVNGAKGYQWLESESVQLLKCEDDIDISYYRKLVDEAIDSINEFGDFEQFVA